jgi:hypothetical protein
LTITKIAAMASKRRARAIAFNLRVPGRRGKRETHPFTPWGFAVRRVIERQAVGYKAIELLHYLFAVLKGEDFCAIRFCGRLHGTGEQIQLLFLGTSVSLIEAFFDASPEREVLGAFNPLLVGKVIKNLAITTPALWWLRIFHGACDEKGS